MISKSQPVVDWVTATTTSRRQGTVWMEIWQRYKDRAAGPVSQVKMYGFVGLSHEGLIWAQRERDGRFMMIASSGAAHDLWSRLVIADSNVTRIDLAVDCWLSDALPRLPSNIFRVLSSPAWDANQIKYTLYRSVTSSSTAKRGETLYTGSRSSEVMGRLYDKGLETGLAEEGRWYRYEVEFKGARAKQVSLAFNQCKTDGYDDMISNTVHALFLSRYIAPLWSLTGNSQPMHLRSLYTRTTNDKRITWLSTQVAPTVAYLFEAGLGDRVMAALGLDVLLPDDSLLQLRQAAKSAASRYSANAQEDILK